MPDRVPAQPYKENPDPDTQTQAIKRWLSAIGQRPAAPEGTVPSSPRIGRMDLEGQSANVDDRPLLEKSEMKFWGPLRQDNLKVVGCVAG